MKAAIDWVTKAAGTGAYTNVDASRIMAAGFSCGGLEAIDNIWDSRVNTIGVISSGLLRNQSTARDWRKPVLFVMGGSADIAYANVSSPRHYAWNYFRVRSQSTNHYTRASATTTTCLVVFLLGRATYPSAMVVHWGMLTAERSARPFSIGCCGP
jgi:hypothetical protein